MNTTASPDAASLAPKLSALLEEIAAERQRQIDVEGWSAEHDDAHENGEIADAAACYAATTRAFRADRRVGRGYEVIDSYGDI